MLPSELPAFDVPFICANCQQKYGSSPRLGLFPQASICEFTYPQSSHPWRIFTCCPAQQMISKASFSVAAAEFKVVWCRDQGEGSSYDVDRSPASRSDVPA